MHPYPLLSGSPQAIRHCELAMQTFSARASASPVAVRFQKIRATEDSLKCRAEAAWPHVSESPHILPTRLHNLQAITGDNGLEFIFRQQNNGLNTSAAFSQLGLQALSKREQS
jgi:hypothetical protein